MTLTVAQESPVQRMHSFAYTPDSARVQSRYRHRVPLSDEDALPTHFHDTKKTRSYTPCTFGSGHGRPSYVSDTPTRLTRRRRIVLDAVEIVRDKKSRRCTTSSHYYPSPPTSTRSTPRDRAQISRSITEAQEPIPPPTTSKYFARVSGSVPGNDTVLTPPSSPVYTLPVYVESSDFEYPPLDRSSNDLLEDDNDPTWYDNPGLFEELMIMLRRLKPILVQESVRDDPWKVLIAVQLLNVTTGKAAIPVFCKIMSHWPTPQDLVHAPQAELVELLRPLGLYNKRAHWLKDVSQRFLEDQDTSEFSRTRLFDEHALLRLRYPGVGPYARDSLCIFCSGDEDAWKYVMPRDKELIRYLRWRWAVEQGKVWYPDGTGVIGDADVPYLITLVDELAGHYDGTIGGEGYMYHFSNDLCEVLTAHR